MASAASNSGGGERKKKSMYTLKLKGDQLISSVRHFLPAVGLPGRFNTPVMPLTVIK